jgi:hypothetical protein
MEKDALDPLAALQNEFYEKYQYIQISFYVALHYATDSQRSETLSMKQSLVILQSCQYKIEDAIEFAQSNSLKGDKIEESVKELSTEVLKKVEYCICKCQSKFLLTQIKKENN